MTGGQAARATGIGDCCRAPATQGRDEATTWLSREWPKGKKDTLPMIGKLGLDGIKLTKLTNGEDIESFFTVFERIMAVQEIPEERWSLIIAPQLTGKAQQAYAVMNATKAADYRVLKETILQRYDIINCKAYQQRSLRQSSSRGR